MPTFARLLGNTALVGTLTALAALPAKALVSLNDGKDKIFVSASADFIHDTNFYANSYGIAESLIVTTFTGEYTRRAGEIGVDANAGLRLGAHMETPDENYQDPFAHLSFTKGTGRTTGALSFDLSRQSDNDAAANLRTEAWTYGSTLKLHYPVIEKYAVSGEFGYGKTDYTDNEILFDLQTYTARMDVEYALSSQHNLLFGYRFRSDDSSGVRDFRNQDVTVGLSGRILPKLNGTVRAGYMWRDERSSSASFSGFHTLASASWVITKQQNLSLQLLRDFSTTSTDLTSKLETASLQYNRVLSSSVNVVVGMSAGRIRYYGIESSRRDDDFSGWNAQIVYSPGEHLRVSFNYNYFNNNSSLGYADYSRNRFSLSVSTRW